MLCCLCDAVFSHFSRILTCDKQTDTDRQTRGHSIYRASIASRGKKMCYVERSIQWCNYLAIGSPGIAGGPGAQNISKGGPK